MPNKELTNVRKRPRPDVRSQRSSTALAHALMQLIGESDGAFEDITVGDILQRAGVGRTTFYAHFRSKEDVLHSAYEGIFRFYRSILEQETRTAMRLFPVAEFVDHVSQSKPVMDALRRSGLAEDMKSHFVGYAASIIESRFSELQLSTIVRARLAARMLAAALIESIDWWVDHASVAAGEIDTAFHSMAKSLMTNGAALPRR